jgi:hypothetical protein
LIGLSGVARGSAHELLLRTGNQNTAGLASGFSLLFLLTGVALTLALLFLLRMEERPLRDAHEARG